MENLNKLTRLLGADRIMTAEDVQQILLGIMEILKSYKEGTESINEETKQVVNSLLEHTVKYNQETISDFKSEAEKEHSLRMKELQSFLSDVKTTLGDMEVMMSEVKDGEDADEERVIEEVINRIKIDPTVVTMSAEEIRDKLASLKDEERLDKSAIKGLEKVLQQKDLDYAVATLQHQASFLINKGGLKVVSHDVSLSGDGTPENPLAVVSSSGLTLQTDGVANGSQTLLNLVGGTNVTLTDNGTGSVTIAATGGSGSGDVVGPASATDNAIARFDGTTGKIVQNSAATIADTTGNITAGTYNGNTIGAGSTSGTNTGDQTASTLAIAKLSTPTVDTVQEYLDSTGSSGYFSGGEITNGAAGTVNIAAGAGFIRATNSTTAQLLSFEWSAFSNVAIASDTTKYIYISYNGGSPTYVLSATATDEDPTKILVGIATNEGGTIVATLNAGVRLDESIGDAGRYLRRVFGFVRDSSVGGLIVSGTGTRNIALSAGTLWYGRTMYNISAIDTSGAGTFATYYRNGSGGFTKTSSVTQWNNTQYDDGTGTLATLTANKWAVAWLYVSADGLFYYVYGRASHTSQAAAETEALPATLPNVITAGTLLVGRLIFQKSASTATFYSAFTNTFSNTGVTLHNDLGSIQGGTSGEYYHLTSAEYTGTGTGNFVRATSPTLTTPAIGTPSSGTLTNCTGLPVAGITASTSTALGVGSIELGNASDTTLSRSAAGQLAVEGVDVLTTSNTKTVTNKTFTNPTINGAVVTGDFQTDGLPDTDDTWTGKSTNSFNAAGTIAQFDCVYLTSSSTWALTDADAIGTAGNVLIMMAGEAGTASNPLRVIEPGSWVRNDAWNWTVGGALYLDTATSGGLTQTAPSGADDVVKVVGYAASADVIYFAPSVNWIIHT